MRFFVPFLPDGEDCSACTEMVLSVVMDEGKDD